jgi:predicted transcriptional regulator
MFLSEATPKFCGRESTVLEKIAEILSATKKPMLKSQIMYKCKLPSAATNIYLQQLILSGLLDAYPADTKHLGGPKLNSRMTYQTSTKGIEFLNRYRQLVALMEEK